MNQSINGVGANNYPHGKNYIRFLLPTIHKIPEKEIQF